MGGGQETFRKCLRVCRQHTKLKWAVEERTNVAELPSTDDALGMRWRRQNSSTLHRYHLDSARCSSSPFHQAVALTRMRIVEDNRILGLL